MRARTLSPYRFSGGVALLAFSFSFGVACDETFPAPLTADVQAPRFDKRPSNLTCKADALPTGAIRLEPAYEGLYRPLHMIDRSDKGLVYFAEMNGRIKVLDKATKALSTAIDLVSEVSASEEQGLFGFAIHPTKPFVYVMVDRARDEKSLKDYPFRSEVVRFPISADFKTFDRASEKLVLRIDRVSGEHSGASVEFGKDGLLYISAGDGGSAKSASDQLPGTIMRIDVDKGDPYAIPPSNPYANGGGRGEIFALGFRNPWRMTIDRQTGDVWAGDVGDARYEEVDKVELGKNYGWPVFEGPNCVRPDVTCDKTGLTFPVFAYAHSEGASVSGGYVYRGKTLPDLVGKYIFADYVTGHIRAIDPAAPGTTSTFLNPGGPKPLIASMGEDGDGELYALGWDNGIVYRLVKGNPQEAPVFPQKLSQTGCVDPADAKKPAVGLVPYAVNVELWSDGASKRRFLAIPDGSTLHVDDDGHFDLPKGGVAVKEFSIDGKRIETRLLRHHTGDEWSGATYEWNDEQTEATLIEAAKDKKLSNGQTWTFPSQVQCLVCHKSVAGRTLGLDAPQFNRDFGYLEGQSTNQLSTLSDIGYFDRRVDPAASRRLPAIDGPAPLEDRARAYLHANCALCHREGGGTGAPMDFRFSAPLAAIKGCTPSFYPGVGQIQIVTPGDPTKSSISIRMHVRGAATGFMPPLASNKVDDVAAKLVDAWITSLKTCE